jgi:hypothetical protein
VEATDGGRLGRERRPRDGRVVVGDVDHDEFDRQAAGVGEWEHRLAESLDAVVVVDAVAVESLLPVVETPRRNAEGGRGDLSRPDLPAGMSSHEENVMLVPGVPPASAKKRW